MLRTLLISLCVFGFVGCGAETAARGSVSSSQALVGTAEWLEFESPAVRRDLFRDVTRQSAIETGSHGAVLFPILVNGEFVAAPAIDGRADLLGAGDAGAALDVIFENRGDGFAEDRRDAFQGLSEREAAEQIARSLLTAWGVKPSGPVTVVRSPGAPYAAALIDGQLRLNPSFIYMASAPAR